MKHSFVNHLRSALATRTAAQEAGAKEANSELWNIQSATNLYDEDHHQARPCRAGTWTL